MSDWSPSPQQEAALVAIRAWCRSGNRQVFRLFGYAGTGKTTLAQYAVADEVDPIFTAYTGKAASVLRRKNCPDARNIHQFLYKGGTPVAPDGEDFIAADGKLPEPTNVAARGSGLAFEVSPRPEIVDASIIVVDEASMIGDDVLADLLSWGRPVLALGDPAQLPPIGGHGSLTAGEPDAFLTEIHRQAADNPIVRLSMLARQGERIRRGVYGDSHVLSLPLDAICRTNAEQILCGRNSTRRLINRMMRERFGYVGFPPHPGERLVCLRNVHGQGLLNGTIWIVWQSASGRGRLTGRPLLRLPLDPEEGGLPVTFLCPVEDFYTFDFGYCLTVHKAQGSEWDTVLLVDESFCFGAERSRWLYTGITRASQRVAVVWRRK